MKKQKTMMETLPPPPCPGCDSTLAMSALSSTTGQNYMSETQAMVIQVSDDLSQDAIDSADVNFQKDLSVIPGVYWKIGELAEWPVFRQEPSDGINGEELFMHHIMHEGWFISSMLFTSHKALQDTSGIVAWAPAVTGSTEPPTSWHVPFWSKKATVGVHASDMISWQQEQLSAGKGGGGRGGGGKGGGGKGSGWLNKAVPLAVAVIGEQHEVALQLAEEVHHHGPNIQKSIKILIYIYEIIYGNILKIS